MTVAPPSSVRWLVRALVAGLAVVLGGWFGAQSAAAHAELLDTSPAQGDVVAEGPDVVELRFNESVQVVDGSVRLFSEGATVDLEARAADGVVAIDLPTELPDGSHTVAYRVISADGHPIGGALAFHVGAPSATTVDVDVTAGTPADTEALIAALSTAQYMGVLAFAGLVFFHVVVLRPGGPGTATMVRVRRYALLFASGASLLLVPAIAARVVGATPVGLVDPEVWTAGFTWPPVQVALAVVVAGWAAHVLAGRGARSGAWGVVALALAAAAAAAPVLAGHSRTVEPGWLMVSADVAHLLAGACWAGGLTGLLIHLGASGPRAGADGDAVAAVGVVQRFSRLALVSVALLVASGVVMAFLVLGSLEAVLTTFYGRMLLLKLGVVAAVVALAAWNRFRLLPAVVRHPGGAAQWEALVRVLRREGALIIAVLVLTGLLANTSPSDTGGHAHDGSSAAAAPFRVESQGLVVDGTLAPGRVGANTLEFELAFDGEPVDGDDVTVAAFLRDEGLGPIAADVEALGSGSFRAALTLPTAGEWELQVTARVSRFEEPIALVDVEIR